MQKYITILLLFLIVFSSCKTQKPATIERQFLFTKGGKGTFFWSQYDATRRGSMMFVDNKNRVRVLAENPPDVAIQSITSITAKLKRGEKIDATLALETNKSIAELGKRTASVNMLRDALYRLNELYYATKDEKEEILNKLINSKSFKITFTKDAITNTNTTKILKSIEDSNSTLDDTLLLFGNDDTKHLLATTISNNKIIETFQKIIEASKEIAFKDATIQLEENKAKLAESTKETERIKLMKVLYEKVKDSLTKKEAKAYLDKLK